ncbi:hypothetical protein [Sphingomonas sanxanigenens]|uniref:Uncharacterized protein n=1 Tax=Sphingomonas sanxanigenens DSM 19645 = NX02 TaxID=1123269 RepID=W0A9A9_9SPHN|nr:hypothetical protein [Sphingomonas sanxanigenens]AHE53676.1 hypothetical protein NX02_09780 [Sphingomonas sanxanigenens DSM 19645 = NX02]
MEERARAAADASRAKTSDSDALQRNYVTPGLSGQSISTVDNSRTFAPNIACSKTATMLEVLAQPSGTGDLGTVTIARDTDLDGTVDSTSNLPMPVSGICANGVVSCQPGSWNNCSFFRWDVDAAKALKLSAVDMPKLAGCYCINNSCGTNLAWGNMASVLRDLGGGMIGALTTADPRYGVAEAVIDGPAIRYVGAQSTACSSNPELPQTAYRSNPATIASDAYAASTGNSVFQALKGSAIGTGTSLQYRHCTIERRVTVLKPGAEDIISRTSGGYSTIQTGFGQNGSSFDFLMGSPADNSLGGGSCTLIDFRMTLHISEPDRIVDARLTQFFADDWAQVRIDGQLVGSGPSAWTTLGLPPSKCELKKTFYAYPNLDLKPFLTAGDHEIWLRVAVAEGGEGFAQVHVDVDNSCKTLEQLVDGCSAIAADPQCKLDSELVDGVQTWINGVATGLKPLPQTRILGGPACPTDLTRDFFLKDRTYRCSVDDVAKPDTSRGAYIIDHSTETMLADRTRQSDGSFASSTRAFSLPDPGSVPACEPVCKTRAPKANSEAAPDGVVGAKQNVPTGYDSFFHACTADNQCPAGPGEEVVSACGCLDDFPEAVVMMQTVRLAAADMVCTGSLQ